MFEIGSRLRRAIEELAGNEALLQMLDTEPAEELLQWGIQMATAVVKKSALMAESDAESALEPRLKAVRKTLRAVGNWAAGQYSDPASRVELKDALLQNFRTMLGDNAPLPAGEKVAAMLDQVDASGTSPRQLILELKKLFEQPASMGTPEGGK